MPERILGCIALAGAMSLVWALAWAAGSLTGEALAQDRIADHCTVFKAALLYDGRAVECQPIDRTKVLPATLDAG